MKEKYTILFSFLMAQRKKEIEMEPGDIRINQVIVHILDSALAVPVLSDTVLDYGSDLGDFLKHHICRVFVSDEVKKCIFDKEESEVYQLLQEYQEGKFVDISKKMAERLFSIMNKNIDIPQADIFVISVKAYEENFLVILKMNYKSSYTHKTSSDPWGNSNDIIKQRAVLPAENQKLNEAVIISLDEGSIRLIEKKYDINGVRTNYFSELFLQCKTSLSPKSKLSIVEKAVADVQKKYYNDTEQFEVKMETKSILNAQLEEKGAIQVPELVDAVFKGSGEMQQEFREKLEKYHLEEEEVAPQDKKTVRKFETQHLKTDTGIEIKIPMEQYNNKNTIEFITNEDGTISMLIKNIGSIMSK